MENPNELIIADLYECRIMEREVPAKYETVEDFMKSDQHRLVKTSPSMPRKYLNRYNTGWRLNKRFYLYNEEKTLKYYEALEADKKKKDAIKLAKEVITTDTLSTLIAGNIEANSKSKDSEDEEAPKSRTRRTKAQIESEKDS